MWPRSTSGRLLAVGLWSLFGLALLTAGYVFLRACGVGGAWLGLSFCTASAAPLTPGELDIEREKAAFLRRQVEQAEIGLAQLPPCPPQHSGTGPSGGGSGTQHGGVAPPGNDPGQACVPAQITKEQELVVILDASLSMILPLALTPEELPRVRAAETADAQHPADPQSMAVMVELLKGQHGRETRMDAAKRELIAAIRPLGTRSVTLVTMRGCHRSDASQGPAQDIERMVGPITVPREGAGTDLSGALEKAAASMRPDPQGHFNGIILMLTDGIQNCPNTKPLCETAEEVRRTRPGVSINVIDMAGYTQQLECVAAGTGRLWHVGAGADLRGLLRQAQTYVDPTSCPRRGG
jgi:hypothetical protein